MGGGGNLKATRTWEVAGRAIALLLALAALPSCGGEATNGGSRNSGGASGTSDAHASDAPADSFIDAGPDAPVVDSVCPIDCTPSGSTPLPSGPCEAYATAVCAWFGRCESALPYEPSATTCAAAIAAQCEQRLGIVDQGLVANDYTACARAAVDAPCGCTVDVVPECIKLQTTPGLRGPGAPCDDSAQCDSLLCNDGFCLARLPLGSPCDATSPCEMDARCNGICEPRRGCDDPCSSNADCLEPMTCHLGTCALPSRIGSFCWSDGTVAPASEDPCSEYLECRASPTNYPFASCEPILGPPTCDVDCSPVLSSVLPPDPCDAFAEAHCSWFERCNFLASDPTDCRPAFRTFCESLYGLSGQTTSSADVLTCAETLAGAGCSCSSETIPACLSLKTATGTLSDGMACQVDTQCESSWCANGLCMARTPAGEACSSADRCERGYFCGGTCEPERTCGEPCTVDDACGEPLTCGTRGLCVSKGDCATSDCVDYSANYSVTVGVGNGFCACEATAPTF